MHQIHKTLLLLLAVISLTGCQKMRQNKLERQMGKLAKTYLQQDEIKDYKNLEITSIDTLTEYGYAKLNSELLGNMAEAYEQMFWEESDSNKREVIGLSMRETQRTKQEMDELIENGDLLTQGVLLFMVTGNYSKGGENQEFMFLVNPDKKSLHYLDPFGNNLLYKEE